MADIEVSLSGVRNFLWSMGVVLILGVSANVYLVWLSARRRLSVRWDTFSLLLRYSSVIDLSMCALLASFVMWSSAVSYARSDVNVSFQCGDFELKNAPIYGGVMIVASGCIVTARQAIMLFGFEPEVTVLRQTRMRVATVLRNLAVAGVVCFLGAVLAANFGPDVHLRMCYVVGSISSHVARMLLAPSVVLVVVCTVVIARSTRADNEYKRHETNLDKADDSGNSAKDDERCIAPALEDFPDQESDSRWNKFIAIVLRMAVVTWVLLTVVMKLAGVVMRPVSIHTFVVLAGTATMTSIWSALAITRHWTLN